MLLLPSPQVGHIVVTPGRKVERSQQQPHRSNKQPFVQQLVHPPPPVAPPPPLCLVPSSICRISSSLRSAQTTDGSISQSVQLSVSAETESSFCSRLLLISTTKDSRPPQTLLVGLPLFSPQTDA
ncbi:hypothetical protein EYF80_029554 [Liparis tanakae]|uniref:Uncharacterized protein n=1 Tax=Liparis tanakae TaxID=230148 RepID=A0A4Z2H373_9TELE|nr:hypothetical protein EYF80_029554 [Liparis tanakae]